MYGLPLSVHIQGVFLRDSRNSSNIYLYKAFNERARDWAGGCGGRGKVYWVTIWPWSTFCCLWEPQPYQEAHLWLLWQRMTTKATFTPQWLFRIETWILKQMHLEHRCGKEEKHKCCLLGALQTENYYVSNTIDFLQQLIFQSECSMSESLRTLSRRNMIVS